MEEAPQKAITPEVDSQETTLPPPHFDELAEQMARPVVPLAAESAATNYGSTTNRGSRLTPFLSKKGSWLLAAFVGLILTVGAMAIGVNTYRRNQAVPTQSLAQAAQAIQIVFNQKPRLSEPLRSNVPAIAKTGKRGRPAQTADDGRPKARLVDSYTLPR